MKKKSICWIAGAGFCLLLVIGLAGSGLVTQKNKDGETVPIEETENFRTEIPSAESMALQEPETDAGEYKFVIGIRDGKLVVYHSDSGAVFFETGINAADMDDEMLRRIEEGLYFPDEQGLYEFLENCSS